MRLICTTILFGNLFLWRVSLISIVLSFGFIRPLVILRCCWFSWRLVLTCGLIGLAIFSRPSTVFSLSTLSLCAPLSLAFTVPSLAMGRPLPTFTALPVALILLTLTTLPLSLFALTFTILSRSLLFAFRLAVLSRPSTRFPSYPSGHLSFILVPSEVCISTLQQDRTVN